MDFEILGRVTIGVLNFDKYAVIVDSGIDENDIRKVINNVTKNGKDIFALLITHAHSDHSGGAYFASKRGIKVYSSKLEADLIMNPSLLNVIISGFYNGQISESKFVTPNYVKVNYLEQTFKVGDEIIEVIDLKGHSLGQVGFKAKDVLFAGDSLFSIDILEKHPIPYVLNVPDFIKTLDMLYNFSGKIVISHGGLIEDNKKVISYNKKRIEEMIELFKDFSASGIEINVLIKRMLNHYNSGGNMLNYFLDTTAIKSIIFSYGKVEYKDGDLIIMPVTTENI
jgi:glyoxylase-like metal-dependent hydrolase (beta-lactamase superfamily II)